MTAGINPLEDGCFRQFFCSEKLNTNYFIRDSWLRGGDCLKNLDLPKEEVIKCFHYGNETIMYQLGQNNWGTKDLQYENFKLFKQT